MFVCEWCGRPKTTWLTERESRVGDVLKKQLSTLNMQVHHLTYERLGKETFSDLVVICDECHERLHGFVAKLTAKGFARWDVMARLAPYCIRRLVKIHDLYRGDYYKAEA